MLIVHQLDDREVKAALRGFAQAVPGTIAAALRPTANDGQRGARAEMRSRFTIAPSRVTFMERLIKVEKASDAEVVARGITVHVAAPEAAGVADKGRIEGMLTRHESGGTHVGAFFLPTDVLRPTQTSLVPRAMYPSALFGKGGLRGAVRTLTGQKIGKRARKAQGLTGIGGTFMILPSPTNKGGIFQRTGSGFRQLWAFVNKIVIPPRLRFEDTIRAKANAVWPEHAERAVRLAARKLGFDV